VGGTCQCANQPTLSAVERRPRPVSLVEADVIRIF
jgi:hypothetical protein